MFFYSICLGLRASTSFEHHLLILRRHYTSSTWYIACVLCQLAASWGWASNARNMQRPLIFNKLNEKCITLVSLHRCTTMHGQQNIKPLKCCLIETQRLSFHLRPGILWKGELLSNKNENCFKWRLYWENYVCSVTEFSCETHIFS
jgi:hypothetical protein